jgi:large subunit ribosomal protein L29
MKASQMRDMSKEDLVLEQVALREQLFKLRFQVATGQLEGAARMRGVRKDIARAQTILRELELAEEAKKQGAGK